MSGLAKLGKVVWAQGDELRHAAAVIGTVLGLCFQPRYWARRARNLFARQVLEAGAVVKRKFGLVGDAYFEITRGHGQPLPEKNASIICNQQRGRWPRGWRTSRAGFADADFDARIGTVD